MSASARLPGWHTGTVVLINLQVVAILGGDLLRRRRH
jgi:uncharacterized membrane protein (DUF2068 family)